MLIQNATFVENLHDLEMYLFFIHAGTDTNSVKSINDGNHTLHRVVIMGNVYKIFQDCNYWWQNTEAGNSDFPRSSGSRSLPLGDISATKRADKAFFRSLSIRSFFIKYINVQMITYRANPVGWVGVTGKGKARKGGPNGEESAFLFISKMVKEHGQEK